ncbi:MAG: hypothetical protein VYB50_04235 [Candidatus Thermoplasmatota archaeon]|nr:hypothetical protein [Candidatus Thermoplasmatota archaeon]
MEVIYTPRYKKNNKKRILRSGRGPRLKRIISKVIEDPHSGDLKNPFLNYTQGSALERSYEEAKEMLGSKVFLRSMKFEKKRYSAVYAHDADMTMLIFLDVGDHKHLYSGGGWVAP